ncbi:hypothetical protein C8Q77DRAFT_1057513 [Trametes polyzona]|nr:hypothetical protein C8Q77DRAFT_1057513 [Trametes polyzona]
MIIGARYREEGKTRAALAVVSAMIEVMVGYGLDALQLKPAILMQSSCHMDIARQLRAQAGAETIESKFHLAAACEGFRKIYGAFTLPHTPVHQEPTVSAPHVSQSHVIGHCEEEVAYGRLPSTPEASSSSSVPVQPPTLTPRYSQVKILEREVQSLRDRQADQAALLSRIQASKRRLEDDLEAERSVRRKLERQLERAESNAVDAQKCEKSALDQCREEVKTRRRAEERAEEMRLEAAGVRAELEPRIAEYGEWERRFKEFFGRLGIVFLKAARGELGEVLTGR